MSTTYNSTGPVAPHDGDLWINSDNGRMQVYSGTAWRMVDPAPALALSPSGPVNLTVQSTTALTVARTGATYALQVDTNTASSVTGLKVTAGAAAGGLALAVIGGNAAENLTLDAKGAGTVVLGSVSTGGVGLGGTDVLLFREAANILALRNGSTAQTLRVYNTFTDVNNNEAGGLAWSSNVLTMGQVAAPGTGTARQIQLVNGNGTARVTIDTTGSVTIAAPVSGTGLTVSGGGLTVTAGGLTVTAGGITLAKETNHTVTVAATTTAATAGGALTILSGAGNTTGAGGLLSLTGGAGGATGTGGGITLTTGAGGATSGPGGALTAATGTTSAESASASGSVTVQSGLGSNSTGATNGGASGAVTVQSQAGGTAVNGAGGLAGTVSILGGAGGAASGAGATGGAGAAIAITAGAGGNGGTASGVPGNITLTAGAAGTGGNVKGGDIIFIPGAPVGTGAQGLVKFGASTSFVAASAGAPTLPTFASGYTGTTAKWLRIYDNAGAEYTIPCWSKA